MIKARSIAPILSGILLTLSFPPLCRYYLAWIAFIPLFWAIERASFKDGFKMGLIAGFSHYLSLLYWITIAIGRYGNVNLILQLVSLFLLCIYLSLYFGIFCYFFKLSYDRWFSVLLIPSFWTLLEFLRARLLSGFPWCLLGYSQFGFKILIQVADITGVYGISLLVMMGNTTLYNIFFVKREGYIKGLLLNLTIF
ncbi:MAG TPA: apolipoprotein N-acyltransferase, partial [Desulfobacteraceae bacterium]|nr:apolipoprotein N-acyltransferase [Desulfobacteraceae bacterium]